MAFLSKTLTLIFDAPTELRSRSATEQTRAVRLVADAVMRDAFALLPSTVQVLQSTFVQAPLSFLRIRNNEDRVVFVATYTLDIQAPTDEMAVSGVEGVFTVSNRRSTAKTLELLDRSLT